jgi:hypothetical protein
MLSIYMGNHEEAIKGLPNPAHTPLRGGSEEEDQGGGQRGKGGEDNGGRLWKIWLGRDCLASRASHGWGFAQGCLRYRCQFPGQEIPLRDIWDPEVGSWGVVGVGRGL